MLDDDAQPDPDLRAAIRHAIANLHPRPADINAILEILSAPALLGEVLALLGEVHEVADGYVIDCPEGRGRVYVVRADPPSR